MDIAIKIVSLSVLPVLLVTCVVASIKGLSMVNKMIAISKAELATLKEQDTFRETISIDNTGHKV